MNEHADLPELTQKEAALQLARAFNRLDPVDLIPLLAEEVVMDSD